MLAEAHPPSGPGRRTTLHHRDRSNNSQNHPRAEHASAAPRSIPDDELPLGADSAKTDRNASRGDGADDTDPARPLCSPAAANDLVASTTAELHTNAHSRQWGGMTGPDGR